MCDRYSNYVLAVRAQPDQQFRRTRHTFRALLRQTGKPEVSLGSAWHRPPFFPPGLVNAVVPVADLEKEGVKWANEILGHSPLAIRCLKSAFNAELDGQSGVQELAGNATLLYYMGDEAKEFHAAQREKRKPKAEKFP